MNRLDFAGLDGIVRDYFGAFARQVPEGFAAALAGSAGNATLDDVRAAIRASLDDGPRSPSSAPALARAARALHADRAGAKGERAPCACWLPPHVGRQGVGVRVYEVDGKGACAALAACSLCEATRRGPADKVRRVDPRLPPADRTFYLEGHDAREGWHDRAQAELARLYDLFEAAAWPPVARETEEMPF